MKALANADETTTTSICGLQAKAVALQAERIRPNDA
jgi:hypothetical protein